MVKRLSSSLDRIDTRDALCHFFESVPDNTQAVLLIPPCALKLRDTYRLSRIGFAVAEEGRVPPRQLYPHPRGGSARQQRCVNPVAAPSDGVWEGFYVVPSWILQPSKAEVVGGPGGETARHPGGGGDRQTSGNPKGGRLRDPVATG